MDYQNKKYYFSVDFQIDESTNNFHCKKAF